MISWNLLISCWGRAGFERKTPPQGYICHRCKVPGMFMVLCLFPPPFWSSTFFLFIKLLAERSIFVAKKRLTMWNFVFRALHSALPYKWWSKFRHQKGEATNWYTEVHADGNPRWLIRIAKWCCSCLETKWVSWYDSKFFTVAIHTVNCRLEIYS